MDVRLLGPVEASIDGRPIAVGAGKPRALLALLALQSGSVVPSERIVAGLWGEEPPASATKLVQLHISHLRKAIGNGAILTRGHAYELQLGPDDLDVHRFEQLVESRMPREALALWRGPALDDVSAEPFAAAEIRRLEELRLAAVEQAIDWDLEAGRHREVIGELERIVLEEPLRERFHAQRMLALYRAGRQAEALGAYRQARTALVTEIGVEPGPELRRLHDALLRQDPALEGSGHGRSDAAQRLAVDRPALRAVEDELVGDVVALQAAREGASVAPGVVVCPFKGLASFEVDDAPYYFGRERLVAELIARLTGAPLTGIVGASGSGKSSLLRAGLLASLAAGVLPGSEDWAIALLRPGEHPCAALDAAIADAPPTGRLVIAVDQFEELFTVCTDPAERAAFADVLAVSARDPRRRAVVLLAIRGDYYGRCAAFPELARLLGANQVLVGPMHRDDLRRAIELPARRAQLEVEPDLADALIAGVEGAPGALPLLSTSLLELWQHRDDRTLRLAEYEHLGGVDGAVARMAERAYERLDPGQRPLARRILLRMAGDGDVAVRRRVALAELGTDHEFTDVLSLLADERLITIAGDQAEVAHEALLHEWPRLRSWLQEDVEGRRLHNHLARTTRDWISADRDDAELYRGARLASALDWVAEHEEDLSGPERQFLAQSRAASERESERQREANRRLRSLLAAGACLLALAVVAGVVALSQRGEARDAARVADAQRLGADALNRARLDDAMLLARAGIDLDQSVSTRSSLGSVLHRIPAAVGELPTDGRPLYTVAVSPGERLVAIGDESGGVTVFDARTRRRVGGYRLRAGLVQQLTFSNDGQTLAVAGQEPANQPPGALVDLVDVQTLQRRRRIVLPPFPRQVEFAMANVVFLRGDRELVIQQMAAPEEQPSVLRRYDAGTGRQLGQSLSVRPAAQFHLSATADRRLLVAATGGDETLLIDPARMDVVRRLGAGGVVAEVSADGRRVALGSKSGEVRLLEVASGRARTFDGAHDGRVVRVAFARGGRSIVSTGEDGKVGIWDVGGRRLAEMLEGHDRGALDGLDISPDGRTAYSGGNDGRVIMWDVAGDRRLDTPFDAGAPFVATDDRIPRPIALSPSRSVLAIGQSDGTVALVDARTLRRARSVRVLRGIAAAVAFSADGKLLAVGGQDGELRLLDARTLRSSGSLRGLSGVTQAISFSPDGALIVAADLGGPEPGVIDGHVRAWNVRTRARAWASPPVESSSIAFSRDGRLLAAADGVTTATQVLDVRSGRPVRTLNTGEFTRSVAFSPDGKYLAIGDFSGNARLWSTATWTPVGRRMKGHTERIQAIDFTPDGRTFATAAGDGNVQLWDAATQRAIGSPLAVEPDAYMSAAFSNDGAHLFAVSEFHRGVRWDVATAAWKRHACRVAGRQMTTGEWRDALPDRGAQPVCRDR